MLEQFVSNLTAAEKEKLKAILDEKYNKENQS